MDPFSTHRVLASSTMAMAWCSLDSFLMKKVVLDTVPDRLPVRPMRYNQASPLILDESFFFGRLKCILVF